MTNLAHFAAAAYGARTRQVAVRAEVSSALAAQESLPGRLQSCCEAIVRHLDVAVARIWLTTKDKRVLELQAGAAMDMPSDTTHGQVAIGHSSIGRIAQSRTPHFTNDAANDPHLSDPNWAPAEGMVAFAGYPLLVVGQAVGVLAVYSRKSISQATVKRSHHRRCDWTRCSTGAGRSRARSEARPFWPRPSTSVDRQLLLARGDRRDHWSEQAYRIFEIDRALPVTLELIARSGPPGRHADVQRHDRAAPRDGATSNTSTGC